MQVTWLNGLLKYSERYPIVVVRLANSEWEALLNSRRGVNEFTIAKPHSLFENVKVPAPCIILGGSESRERVYFGILSSKGAVTTLDSRVRVSRAVEITPSCERELISLVTDTAHARNLADRLGPKTTVTLLTPKLSHHLIDRLASISSNTVRLRAIAASLAVPQRFDGNVALQEDAVRTALTTFGLSPRDPASMVELTGTATALHRVPVIEDSVIEHDARTVPGFTLRLSDVTGRALFQRGDEQLEVFTANRRALEHCLGVDLIYVNLTRQNVVMLQYKMLESRRSVNGRTDWVYRPDAQLDEEIGRMKTFAVQQVPGPIEYRLNPEMFYLKFVKRDAALSASAIITPLDHFAMLRDDPTLKGPKNGVRVSYDALNGRYMRQTPFLELLRCGYIGAHAHTTEQIGVLIEEILDGNEAVIAAIQQAKVRS